MAKVELWDDSGKEAAAFAADPSFRLTNLRNLHKYIKNKKIVVEYEELKDADMQEVPTMRPKCYCESQGPEQESLIEGLDIRMVDVVNLVGTVKKQQTSYDNYSSEQRFLFIYYNQVKLYNCLRAYTN
ncbi:hypothetical protein CU097_007662 [Rhizopus azygosporus]|uniref:Uncharacterized protein n=1 Tax=Rhizopus azygosporus TaxID=86630 RepID=A0A367KDW7_RHIAZ|nr:hypothetical protein CU097_007662 [Rhizopus azygosporus]